MLRCLLQQAGYNPQLYCTHSFRISAATTSAAAGLPPWLIKTLGWWNSNAYLTYIQVPTTPIQAVPPMLARTKIQNDLPSWNPDHR